MRTIRYMIRTNNDIASTREQVGARLAEFRNTKALLQHELAESIGISPRSYQNYELGIRAAPMEVISKIAEKHGVSAHWLITGEGYMFYSDPKKTACDALQEIFVIAKRLGVTIPQHKLPDLFAPFMESYLSLRGPQMIELENLVRLASEAGKD
ncbi:MAG: helix-turn-helix transcriptional regulator [Rhodobacteraceae bacterium]|nr:helix-turn-helix transcriptional regulator [Paracoccaceae bacterium]